ncbi:MAG: rhodanese-related sulfurtransferase [Flavobacteriales bacterium]|nr:rhodanese-related sulfurtransferase [Flavobacteriales bacterium]MCB9193951.1 rhodanese-related sulfurtransferase [Flavobacteriales bacterium]
MDPAPPSDPGGTTPGDDRPTGGAPPRTTLSFYRYERLSDPTLLRDTLHADWSVLGVLGRTYLAREGINAQVSVPSENLSAFRDAVDAVPEFAGVPWKIALEENGSAFRKLTIKVKPKLVADGLSDGAFDPGDVGEHLDAATFNRKMEEGALVIDMRNNYESAIGHFEGAYLPKADTFRDAINEVAAMLRDRSTCIVDPLNRPNAAPDVLLYCTGGIRCEKASAYLKHEGFTNVGQLHGGIIDYVRQVRAQGRASRFKGRNFVFDDRLSERITDDLLGTCVQCGQATDRIANCMEESCNLLLVQCPACAAQYADCCSPSCQEIHLLPAAHQREWRKGRITRSTITKAITDAETHQELIREQEAALAINGTLHPELMDITLKPM